MVTQIRQVVPAPINDATEVTPNMSTSSPSIIYKEVSNMFVDYGKTMKNQMQQMIERGLAKYFKILNISSDSPNALAWPACTKFIGYTSSFRKSII
jgi:hypothetical protein